MPSRLTTPSAPSTSLCSIASSSSVGQDGDLPDLTHRPEEARAIGIAGDDTQRSTAQCEALDELPADKAGAAENRDDLVAHKRRPFHSGQPVGLANVFGPVGRANVSWGCRQTRRITQDGRRRRRVCEQLGAWPRSTPRPFLHRCCGSEPRRLRWAQVAELVDALASGASDLLVVEVRFLLLGTIRRRRRCINAFFTLID